MERLTGIAQTLLQFKTDPEPPEQRRTDFQSRLNPPNVPPVSTRIVEGTQPAAAARRVQLDSPLLSIFRDAETGFARGARAIDEIISASEQGRELNPQKLLALQAQMYRYTEDVELLSKIVEQLVTIVRELLKTQV